MSFDSVNFLVFFPIVAIAYYLIPVKTKYNIRSLWLLFASYYFYMSWNAKYAILILFSTVVTYACSVLMDNVNEKVSDEKKAILTKKIYLITSLLINIGILGLFKYGQFFLHNVFAVLNRLNSMANEPKLDLLLPVGISFYTFQALGYTIDVYRKDIKAERNFVQYALFVSFFPQLVAGPIERSKNLLLQLREDHYFDFENVREGLLIMLWGFFMKLVIADRAGTFVDTVYNDFYKFNGFYIVIGTVLFGIQIYCDFNGYTMIARGAAKIMGFNLMENFDAPFLSETVADLWKRWHVSLTSWFRDYLYIPLGGSRKGKLRKHINILIVNGISGLWHGANWTYVCWGLSNGIFQIIGEYTLPVRKKIVNLFDLNVSSLGHRILKILFTFGLFNVSLTFFRIDSLHNWMNLMQNMFTNNIWILVDHRSLYECGLGRYDLEILLFAILILLVADICKLNKFSIIKDFLYKQDTWFRWSAYIISFYFVLIFGIWGSGYENAAFLYFQF